MDTGTHFIMGIGLAGLAHIDPVVSQTPGMSEAILIATVLGSQAPDFDSIFRLKGNAYYISKHRGASHSIPALIGYCIILTFCIAWFYSGISIPSLLLWTSLALGIHVLTDLLNEYGTQVLQPFSEKWIAWNILHIFDPVIFISHVIGIALWFLGSPPGLTFALIYAFLTVYILWRTWIYRQTIQSFAHRLKGEGEIKLFPTLFPFQWNILLYSKEFVRFGRIRQGEIIWMEQLPHLPNHPVVEVAKNHPDIRNFLYFSQYAHVDYSATDFGYEVRWVDLRYRHKKNYPLLATVYLNNQLEPIGSYVGYKQEEKVYQKLKVSIESQG